MSRKKTVRPPVPDSSRRFDYAIWLGLILSILVVYAQTAHYGFVNYDDDLYVYENPNVQAGITLASLKWALTAVVSSNWMPVTLISHMLDVQLFGLRSGPQHLVNVAFHALSSLLLFAALQRATRMRWPSAFAAFVFALHPLHVGSVAWIAERKDVLSAFFWFAALLAYVRYAARPGRGRYLLVAGLFSLGLMSKPMLVTFPFTLLLFDLWPLRRFAWPKSVLEKLPLVALSAIASAVSYLVQASSGAVQPIALGVRIENALISYVVYIGQTLWPSKLSVFYPYPRAIEGWQIAAATVFLAAVSWFAIRAWRTHPYLTVGWLWYLGTLVPVIGLVQVGMQSHADRYTYIPMVGLTLMLAWGVAEAAVKWPGVRRFVVVAAPVSCAALLVLSSSEAAHWEGTETLFGHAIDSTTGNWLAEYDLGHYLVDQPGRMQDAIAHFEAALRILPDYPEAHNNLGTSLLNTGRIDEAAVHFQAAVQEKPDFADAHVNLGLAYMRMPGHGADAEAQFDAALRLNPDHQQAHNSLGVLLVQLGRVPEAVPHLEAAVRLRSDYQDEQNLGAVLVSIPARRAEGIRHMRESQRLHPDAEIAKALAQIEAAQK